MNDEFGGIIVSEFIRLKSKMYSIKKLMVKNIIQQKEYCKLNLINLKMFYLIKKIIRQKMKKIQSKKHKLGTYEIDKISLSCFDDKRYVLDDGIHTLSCFRKNCHIIIKMIVVIIVIVIIKKIVVMLLLL